MIYNKLYALLSELKTNLKNKDYTAINDIITSIQNIINHESIVDFDSNKYLIQIGELINRPKLQSAIDSVHNNLSQVNKEIDTLYAPNLDLLISDLDKNITLLEGMLLQYEPGVLFDYNNYSTIAHSLGNNNLVDYKGFSKIGSVYTNAVAEDIKVISIDYDLYEKGSNGDARIASLGKVLGTSGDHGSYYQTPNMLLSQYIELEVYKTIDSLLSNFMINHDISMNGLSDTVTLETKDNYKFKITITLNKPIKYARLNIDCILNDYDFHFENSTIKYTIDYPIDNSLNDVTQLTLSNIDSSTITLYIDGTFDNLEFSNQQRVPFYAIRNRYKITNNATGGYSYALEIADIDNVPIKILEEI